MKKFLLVFLIFISVAEMKISFGQTYHPFPDTLAQWSEGSLYVGMCCSGEGYIYAEAGDTVIDNLVYTLLGYNLTYTWNTYWYQSPENFSYQIPGEIFGALREDSSKRIWFRNFDSLLTWVGCFNFSFPYFPFPTDSDMLLYDFGLGVGDTAYWAAYEFGKVVMSIDSIQLLDGSLRRVIDFDTLSNNWNNYGPDFWVEGVGSPWGLFGPFCREPFEGECSLTCFTKVDSLLVESSGFYNLTDCNHIYTGSSQIESPKSISVFPNPASEFITFDPRNFPNEKLMLTIYNSKLQQVNQYSNLHSAQLKIPVSHLGADGLYFYTISFDDQKIFAGKFMVQR